MTASLQAQAKVVPDILQRAPQRRFDRQRLAASLVLVLMVVAGVVALARVNISIPAMIASRANAERFFVRVGGLSFPAPGDLVGLIALTLGIVVTGTVLAAILSVPVAYLAAANTSPGPGWRAAARFVSVFARAMPDVVLAMVFVLVFSLGALPGVLAIGLHSIGMISKMFADAIEQIDEGPRLAIRAAGGTRSQEFLAGVLPQVLPSWVATVLHRNDINLRGSVVLGYVGVAGLGLEMSYAFKSLDYGRGLGIALVMFILCVVMEIISSTVRAAMLGVTGQRTWADRLLRRLRRANTPADHEDGEPAWARTPQTALRRPWTSTRIRDVAAGWFTALLIVAGVWVCRITWGDFITVWAKIPDVARQFWPPDFGAYGPAVMLDAMGQTISIAFAATLLTFVASMIIGSFAARNVAPGRGTRGFARLLLVVIRGVPELILAIVLIVITGLGLQAGTIALAFGGVGLLGKLIADSFEEVNRGPELALSAAGATRPQVYAGATLPQGIPSLIGHSFYLLDNNVRSATILGIVGGGGVGYYLLNASQGSFYGLVTAIVLMILVVVLVIEAVAMWMRSVFR